MNKKYIIILILMLTIGFASITTTLVLNGKVGVGIELDDFDVIFIESLLDGKEDTKATISEDKKTITFSTDKFINKGESARLDYKVKNTSTQYNADVEINCTNEANEYVNVISSFDGNQIPLISPINIKAQEVKSGYINAELIKAYAGEDTSIEIKCTINVTATSRETYAYSLMFNSNGGSSIDDKSVVLNEEYGALEEPVREGYTFLGWYDEEDNKVDETTIFDSKGNRNLKAKWEEKIYDLNIVTQKYGNSTTNKVGITYGNKVTIKINEKNYYISNIECSDGYSIEDYELVIPTYGEQVINIKNNKVDKEGTCTFTLAQGIFEYGYTGGEQVFSVPLNGEYKIELWGASGGTSSMFNSYVRGGYGAYSTGKISLEKKHLLYINVGGKPSDSKTLNVTTKGGYNGGGTAVARKDSVNNAGGGATHIAFRTGLLVALSNFKESVLVVAGGGGGESSYSSSRYGIGGDAGGISGNNGQLTPTPYNCESYGYGGTQATGGGYYIDPKHHRLSSLTIPTAGFGFGSSSDTTDGGAGGGGGWYGGRGTSCLGGAGGGSSYIGNPLLIDKSMYCYNCQTSNAESTKTISTTCTSATPTANCAKLGHGYAKITYLG